VVDVTDRERLEAVIETYDVDTVFHLASILSAVGEKRPHLAFEVNVRGLYKILEVGRNLDLETAVVPSSIAVFGEETPAHPKEWTILSPTTMYGISKVFGEHIGTYYYQRYVLDVRGVWLPGIVSHKTEPGGGTTDYAVEAFYRAVEAGSYTYLYARTRS